MAEIPNLFLRSGHFSYLVPSLLNSSSVGIHSARPLPAAVLALGCRGDFMQPAPAAHAQSVHGCGHGQHGREKMGGRLGGWEGDGSWEFSLGIRHGRLLG